MYEVGDAVQQKQQLCTTTNGNRLISHRGIHGIANGITYRYVAQFYLQFTAGVDHKIVITIPLLKSAVMRIQCCPTAAILFPYPDIRTGLAIIPVYSDACLARAGSQGIDGFILLTYQGA